MRKSFIYSLAFLLSVAGCKLHQQHTSQQIQDTPFPAWAMVPFERPAHVNPVISPNASSTFIDPMSQKTIAWEANDTFNPAATVMGDSIYVLYRAEDRSGVAIGERTSRIGLAASADGIHMNRQKMPVLFPANDQQKKYEWTGGCEDPRVAVTEVGMYVMLYTQWNKDTPRIGVATSTNLTDWTKHGPAFEDAYDGKFLNMASKSASLITKVADGKQTIARINGTYWIYWGEHHVYAATSTNLTDWKPLVDEDGELLELMSPRPGYFDSDLTECGPPAVVTDAGIVLFYNGKNKPGIGRDTAYTANTYCAGQALFNATDPTKFVDRLDEPFLVPSEPFEKSGQYPAGTVFIEGLVLFKKQWFLYYGCADSKVAVAVMPQATP